MGRDYRSGRSALRIHADQVADFGRYLDDTMGAVEDPFTTLKDQLGEYLWEYRSTADNVHLFVLDDSESDADLDFDSFVSWSDFMEDGSHIEELYGDEAPDDVELQAGEYVLARWEKQQGVMTAGLYGVLKGKYRLLEEFDPED